MWSARESVVPEISTDVALRHVNRAPPFHSKLHTPPFGCSVRTASQSPCGIVILIVSTLSIAYSESSACCCCALIVISPCGCQNFLPRLRSARCRAIGREQGLHPRIISARTIMFACMPAPFVAHPSRGGAVSIRRCSPRQCAPRDRLLSRFHRHAGRAAMARRRGCRLCPQSDSNRHRTVPGTATANLIIIAAWARFQ